MAVRPAWGHALCALVLLFPFCASLTAHIVRPSPSPMADPSARPPLAFDQYLVDLGVVPPSEEVKARFRFRNTGKLPVSVVKTDPSCGCLKPHLSRETLQPGESSEIQLRVRTAGVLPGDKDFSLAVHYQELPSVGDATPLSPLPMHRVDLAFRVNLPAKQVLVQPRALIFFQMSEKATEQELTVLDQREKGLKILSAVSSTKLAEVTVVTVGTTSDNAEGAHVSRLTVKVTGRVEGRHQGAIQIQTDDPVYKRLTIPLIIEGHTDPNAKIAAHPGTAGKSPTLSKGTTVR